MSEANTALSNYTAGPRLLYPASIVVLLAFGFYAAFVLAPATRAKAQSQLDREIAGENLAFCEKFGMRAGTNEFGVCSQQLAIIREKQSERDRATWAE